MSSSDADSVGGAASWAALASRASEMAINADNGSAPGPDGTCGIIGPGGAAGMLHPLLAPLLAAVQQQRLFPDSKTAVDLTLRQAPKDIAAAVAPLLASGADLSQAVADFTLPVGGELEACTPAGWRAGGPQGWLQHLDTAEDGTQLKQFAVAVYDRWGILCRKMTGAVYNDPPRSSLLAVPNAFVVPGDRFQELYYWDSYWVIRGLLVSELRQTALDMVDNLLALAKEVGHMPNGARVYYINRSQPPLLSQMVRDVYEATNDLQLLKRALPTLVQEHAYWTSAPKQVTIQGANGQTYSLSRYYAHWYLPRPESSREDVETAMEALGTSDPSDPGVRQLYNDLASGAESGWDFSSRWLADGRTLGTIRTTRVIPTDLNAWLYQMERNIALFADLAGDAQLGQRFSQAAADRQRAIMDLLWDPATSQWRDALLQGDEEPYALQLNSATLLSNFYPIWTGLLAGNQPAGQALVRALDQSGLVQPGGLATTTVDTGQQWDYPNGWPPLQHMTVEGLDAYGGPEGKRLARQLARSWISNNHATFAATSHMHEKYDVEKQGYPGGGGEYRPQIGFGWSNGVVLDFLAKHY